MVIDHTWKHKPEHHLTYNTTLYSPCNWETSLNHERKHSIPPTAIPLPLFSPLLFLKYVCIIDALVIWAVRRILYCKYGSSLRLWAAYKIPRVGSYVHCQVSESLNIPVCPRGDHQPSPQPWPTFLLLSLLTPLTYRGMQPLAQSTA
jgi:hypothetical protein